MKTLDEKSMQALEEKIPALAEGAIQQAYLHALATGDSVVEVLDGQLVESRADGSFQVLKKLPAPTQVKPGSKIRLQT